MEPRQINVNQWNLEVLIAKKFLKFGKAKTFFTFPWYSEPFCKTYLLFGGVLFFTFYHQNIEKKDCCVSSKTFLSPAYVVFMQFVFKFAKSGGRSVNRFSFHINTSLNYNRRLKSWPLDYGQPLSPKIQLCQIAQTKQNASGLVAKQESVCWMIELDNEGSAALLCSDCSKVRIHANISSRKWFKVKSNDLIERQMV